MLRYRITNKEEFPPHTEYFCPICKDEIEKGKVFEINYVAEGTNAVFQHTIYHLNCILNDLMGEINPSRR